MANKDYTDISEQLRQAALTKAAGGTGAQAPTYAGTYEDQLNTLFDKIQNREPFQYDVNADPLYQQYKDKYVQQGKLAMKDTMGQAAGLTGGYGSTYSQKVGQQTYDSYLQNLSDVIPQLYGMSYDMYKDKGNDLMQQYGLVGQQRDTEYNRYRDELSDYNYQQELARQLEEQEYNRRLTEENTAYNRQQQAYSNLVALIRASGYNPTDQELAASGLTRAAANALRNEFLRGITPVKASGGGGGGGGGRSSTATKPTTTTTNTNNYTFEQIAKAYDNAKTAGKAADASKILASAASAGVISQADKKYIFKNYQVKDRL